MKFVFGTNGRLITMVETPHQQKRSTADRRRLNLCISLRQNRNVFKLRTTQDRQFGKGNSFEVFFCFEFFIYAILQLYCKEKESACPCSLNRDIARMILTEFLYQSSTFHFLAYTVPRIVRVLTDYECAATLPHINLWVS